MTADAARQLCTRAGLHVLRAEAIGRSVVVHVAPLPVTVETARDRLTKLGVGGVTFGFGDGNEVTLMFVGETE